MLRGERLHNRSIYNQITKASMLPFTLPLLLLFGLWYAGTRISTPKLKNSLVKAEQKQKSSIGESFSKGFDMGAKRRVKELNQKGYLIEWQPEDAPRQ
jgi:hypothetical protein